MHARLTRGALKRDQIDQALGTMENDIIPAAKEQDGYRGGFTLVDRSTGEVLTITLWETDADRQAGESSDYYREQLGKVRDYVDGETTVSAMEVGVIDID